MSPTIKIPSDTGPDLTDDEAASLQPTPVDLMAMRAEDSMSRLTWMWEDVTAANARRVDYVEDGQSWFYTYEGSVSLQDFLDARADRRPERPLAAALWLDHQDLSVVRELARYDRSVATLQQMRDEERRVRSEEQARVRAEQHSRDVRASAVHRGQVPAVEIEGGGGTEAQLWVVPRLITTDVVPLLGEDGRWHEPFHKEIVVLAYDDRGVLSLITGTWLQPTDLSVMIDVGLKPADDVAVARTLGTNRLVAARIMSRFDRPIYVYDHAYWTGDPVSPRRSTSRSRKPRRATVADDVAAVIGADQMTVAEIAVATRKSEPSVLLALKRGPFVKSEDRPARWRLAVAEPQAP